MTRNTISFTEPSDINFFDVLARTPAAEVAFSSSSLFVPTPSNVTTINMNTPIVTLSQQAKDAIDMVFPGDIPEAMHAVGYQPVKALSTKLYKDYGYGAYNYSKVKRIPAARAYTEAELNSILATAQFQYWQAPPAENERVSYFRFGWKANEELPDYCFYAQRSTGSYYTNERVTQPTEFTRWFSPIVAPALHQYNIMLGGTLLEVVKAPPQN